MRVYILREHEAISRLTLLFTALILLAGCGSPLFHAGSTATPASFVIKGKLRGGQFPISGASIELFAAGETGYGAGSTPLLAAPATTDQNGDFSITFSCPANNPETYLVSSGGNAGVGEANNPAIALMAAMGPCLSDSDIPFINIDEVTTIASVWVLAPFMNYGGVVGTAATNIEGLATAFTNFGYLADITRGFSPGTSAPQGITVPVAEINTMANILASCVNSIGTEACDTLFADATPAPCTIGGEVNGNPTGGAPSICATPQTTLDAALNMALNPSWNVANLFELSLPTSPFGPMLSSPPASWSLGDAIIDNPVPVISSFSPGSLPPGSAAQTLTISGTGFLASSSVSFNGTSRAVTYLSSGQLTIALTSSDLATAGSYQVVVSNPVPGGGVSAMDLLVAGNPVPTVSALSPASLPVGSAPQTITINGAGFLASSAVTFNGTGRTATYVSPSQLTINLTSADLSAVGSYPVIVSNPTPGGGTSSVVNLIVNWVPAISSLSPVGLPPGSAPQPLTINGAGFLASSTVTFNGTSRAVTYVSLNELTIALTAADLSTFGSYPVVVSNSVQGGGSSSPFNFVVGIIWTWMGGSSTIPPILRNDPGSVGVYGTVGVPNAANVPGGRDDAVSWTDSQGNFWLFGGAGEDANETFGALNDLWEFNVSTREWTWMSGSSTIPVYNGGRPGVYGQLGTPAEENTPGGRSSAFGWADQQGNLWLFGGVGFDAAGTQVILNDLWEYNIASGEWTWVGGSSSAASAGVYGTLGSLTSGGYPGGRDGGVAWTDQDGNFWMFGGNSLNDLWKFVPSTGQWAWMSGSSTFAGTSQVYGQLGVPAAGNTPGSRYESAGWVDASGNLWLFGGYGYEPFAGGVSDGLLNDLWTFNTTANEWTWMGGSDEFTNNCSSPDGPGCGSPGVAGTLGTFSAAAIPGARSSPVVWVDAAGNAWLMGGEGFGASDVPGLLNDLWEFNPATNEWAWMDGPSAASSGGENGVYGMLGVAGVGNIPGGRVGAIGWTGADGSLWLMGGDGVDANGDGGSLNDLWVYQP
jgi:N-acetylneuraminic acid mutarotase